MDGAGLVGDPITVLPVLLHLLWRNELVVDLSVPLHAHSLVQPGAGDGSALAASTACRRLGLLRRQ